MCSLLYTNKKLVMKFIYFIVDATIITLVVMSIQKKKKCNKFNSYFSFYFFHAKMSSKLIN